MPRFIGVRIAARLLATVLTVLFGASLLAAATAQAEPPRKHRSAPAVRQKPAAHPAPNRAIRQRLHRAPTARHRAVRPKVRHVQPRRAAPHRQLRRTERRRDLRPRQQLRHAQPRRPSKAQRQRQIESRKLQRNIRRHTKQQTRPQIRRQRVERQQLHERARSRAERARDRRRERITRRREERELRRLSPQKRVERRREIQRLRQERAAQRRDRLTPARTGQNLTIPAARSRARAAAARRQRNVVTPQAAIAGRFGSRFHRHHRHDRDARAHRHRYAARHAWRRGLHASFVAWAGHLFWPYAYADVFDYTFWPQAYDDGFWAYAYDDFFDSIYWPAGSPYAGYDRAAPYGGDVASAVPGRPASPQIRTQQRLARQLCNNPAEGVTAWPIDRIAKAVEPTEAQRQLLAELRDAASKAAADFKRSCPEAAPPMTPPGRLQAMRVRLQATLEAVQTVRGPLTRFYDSLSDEQKARFNTVGPKVGRDAKATDSTETKTAQDDTAGPACSEAKPGLADLPIDRIADVVAPTEAQNAAFDALAKASEDAIAKLQAACPDEVPQTPVGRLEAMQNRLEAMIAAADTVAPPLQDFYASLSGEQKARFNSMGLSAEAN